MYFILKYIFMYNLNLSMITIMINFMSLDVLWF